MQKIKKFATNEQNEETDSLKKVTKILLRQETMNFGDGDGDDDDDDDDE